MSTQVPGILGMNIIRKCYQELFGEYGPSLFQMNSGSFPSFLMDAMEKCHTASPQAPLAPLGKVRVRGKRACQVPGGAMKIVTATCSEPFSNSMVLLKPPEFSLPAGLLASPALIHVVRGTAYIPIVNVGETEVLLNPHTVMGTLDHVNVVSMPAGVVEVPSFAAHVASQIASTVADQIDTVDLSSLPQKEQSAARTFLRKYASVFALSDQDLGCTNLISHDIPMLDSAPVRQRLQRVPPSEYELVKEHINKLLETRIIRKNSSPYACSFEKRWQSPALRGLPAVKPQNA